MIIEEVASNWVPNIAENVDSSNEESETPERSRTRKIKTQEERLHVFKEERLKRKKEHFKMLSGCGGGASNKDCDKECSKKILHMEREDIHKSFWDFNWIKREKFIRQHVSKVECSRRVTKTVDHKKKCTYRYNLRSRDGKYIQVCKKFFLATLGYKETSKLLMVLSGVLSMV